MSYRLYIGNLDKKVTDEEIRELFANKNFEVDNILLKNGYAFVDCLDQTTMDSAMDQLAGNKLSLHSTLLRVRVCFGFGHVVIIFSPIGNSLTSVTYSYSLLRQLFS